MVYIDECAMAEASEVIIAAAFHSLAATGQVDDRPETDRSPEPSEGGTIASATQ